MAFWLLKSDPEEYSFADLEKEKKAIWDGISNNLALKHLRSMRKGDFALIYHTGDEKSVIGIAEVASHPYTDPAENDPHLVVVEVKPVKRLPSAVPLASIKGQKDLANFELVRISRLSVMPVQEKIWRKLLRMGGEKE
jgi:predicted RNA-binding protein with PUA-like domain